MRDQASMDKLREMKRKRGRLNAEALSDAVAVWPSPAARPPGQPAPSRPARKARAAPHDAHETKEAERARRELGKLERR